MAVAFNAVTSETANDVTSLTFAHTCSGSQRLLVVGVSWNETTISAGGINIASITYAGENLTFHASGINSVNDEVWVLVNPASGANNVVITYGGPGIGTGKASLVAGAVSFTGAGSVGTAAVATGSGFYITHSITGTSADNMVEDIVANFSGDDFVAGEPDSGQTARWQKWAAANPIRIRGEGGTKVSANGNVPMNRDMSGIAPWVSIIIEIKVPPSTVVKDPIRGPAVVAGPR